MRLERLISEVSISKFSPFHLRRTSANQFHIATLPVLCERSIRPRYIESIDCHTHARALGYAPPPPDRDPFGLFTTPITSTSCAKYVYVDRRHFLTRTGRCNPRSAYLGAHRSHPCGRREKHAPRLVWWKLVSQVLRIQVADSDALALEQSLVLYLPDDEALELT